MRTMTEESKPKKTEKQVENLELNRETVQDLTEGEAERVEGGFLGTGQGDPSRTCATNPADCR
jgi:hypothetical protein